jgi:hypothetical protein
METEHDDRDEVERETEAAEAEAGAIGGRAGDEDLDPAQRPLTEAGEGEAEGFEEAERELIEAAEHGDPAGDPLADAAAPEAESDRSTAAYGEPDEVDPTEVVRDPDLDPGEAEDDPGEGPGRASER